MGISPKLLPPILRPFMADPSQQETRTLFRLLIRREFDRKAPIGTLLKDDWYAIYRCRDLGRRFGDAKLP